MSDENAELPEGWEAVTFVEIFDFKGGSQPPKKEFVDEPREGYIRLLQIRDFASDQFPVYIKDADRWPKCDKDDVMIARYGASLGRVLTGMAGAYNVALIKMIFDRENIDTRWARYFLMSNHFQGPIHLLSRSAQNGFNKKEVAPIEVQLPPLAEQRRIVAKIEALQERSRKARELLTEVGPLLEQFRQSLLAAAFRGDLTADWRKQNPNVEPATELLTRIRTERRQKWEEAELTKYEAKSKKPPKDWQNKYKEPDPPDCSELPELPDGWCWTTVAELTENHDSIRVPLKLADREKRSGPYPYYGAFGIIDDIDDYLFDGEYVLLAEDGKNLLERKRPISLIATGKFWVNNHAHILTTFCEMPLAYLECFFNSPVLDLNDYLTGIDQVKLTRGAMDSIPVPLAPFNEQIEIVRLCMAGIDSVNLQLKSLGDSTSDLSQLDQSILAKAFRGELVPQYHGDEPASVLLKRIRESRAARKPARKTGGKRNSTKGADASGAADDRELLDVLQQAAEPMHVDDLQTASGLSSKAFYLRLKDAISRGTIREVIGDDSERYLEPAK